MSLKLLKENELTRGAILLFARDPQKFFIQTEVKCIRFKGIEPVKPFLDFEVNRLFCGNPNSDEPKPKGIYPQITQIFTD